MGLQLGQKTYTFGFNRLVIIPLRNDPVGGVRLRPYWGFQTEAFVAHLSQKYRSCSVITSRAEGFVAIHAAANRLNITSGPSVKIGALQSTNLLGALR